MGANTEIVKEIYAAFGQGRIGDIVGRIAEATDFIHPDCEDVPWSGHRRTPPEVAGFFDKLGAAVEVIEFVPERYVEQGDTVVALGRWAGTARPTGKPFATAWAMVWTFKNGKVTYYRAFEDTAAIAKAFR
jgi:uncharacterized protein